MLQTLESKAKSLLENANATNKTRESAEKYVGTLQQPLSQPLTSAGMLETIGPDTSDDDAKNELETNTDNMVIASNLYLTQHVFSGDFKTNTSIANSLLTYIVTDADNEKYEVMLRCVDYVIGMIKLFSMDSIKSNIPSNKNFKKIVIVPPTPIPENGFVQPSFFRALNTAYHINPDNMTLFEEQNANFINGIKFVVDSDLSNFNIIVFTPTEITSFMKTNPLQGTKTIYLLKTGDYYDLLEPVTPDTENTEGLTIDNVFIVVNEQHTVKLSEMLPPGTLMFGGIDAAPDVLTNVVMEKNVKSDKIKSTILKITENKILKYLSKKPLKTHIDTKVSAIINAQLSAIRTQIDKVELESSSVVTLPLTGGGSHYLKIQAIEAVRESYLKQISEATNSAKLPEILTYSIWSVLKFPEKDNVTRMKPIFENLILLKDEISNQAIDGMELHTKIHHIMNFIENHTVLHDNLVDCVKTQINGGCLDGLFVRLGISTPECVGAALKCFTDSMQNANADRSPNVVISNQPYSAPENTPQIMDDALTLKYKYQDMVSFSNPPDNNNTDVIPGNIWNIINKKLESIDVDGDTLITGFADLCLDMYGKIKLLSNSGLFVLFNDAAVMDKINTALLLFSDLVLNVKLATCDNPGALTPDLVVDAVVMKLPPNKPSNDDSAKLIVFLLKHHLRHMGENKPNVVSVSMNEKFSHDSLMYEGFDEELKNFIETIEEGKKENMTTFTNIVFKRFIGELKTARLTKDINTIENATAQYETSNALPLPPPSALHPAPPPPPPSYGGAKTRKHRAKRNKKTRRH